MVGLILGLALGLALPGSQKAAPAPAPQPARVEKLSSQEIASLAAARKAVDDAEAQLEQAKRNLRGTMEGIEQSHHANTDCGCYIDSVGRDYDKVQFKDDTIVIQHIHEAPPSLSAPSAAP